MHSFAIKAAISRFALLFAREAAPPSSLSLLLLSSASRISRSQSRRRETYFPIYIPIIHPLSLSLFFFAPFWSVDHSSSSFPLPASCKVSRPISALACKYTTEWNLARSRGKVKIKTFRVRFEREWLPFFFFQQKYRLLLSEDFNTP